MIDLEKILDSVPSSVQRRNRRSLEITYKINEMRTQRDWSKKDLAAKAGMKPAQLTRVLRGDSNVTFETITKIEDAFDEIILTIPNSPFVDGIKKQTGLDTASAQVVGATTTITDEVLPANVFHLFSLQGKDKGDISAASSQFQKLA